jgi:hypothetical protein
MHQIWIDPTSSAYFPIFDNVYISSNLLNGLMIKNPYWASATLAFFLVPHNISEEERIVLLYQVIKGKKEIYKV